MKQLCRKCKIEKDLAEFSKNSMTWNKLHYNCKKCVSDRRKNYFQEKKHLFQNYTLQRNHKLSKEDYDSLLASQGGVCAICEKECTTGRSLAVDHNHKTGEIRGLLCSKCNTAIGLMDDDPSKLEAAIKYLSHESVLETV